MPNIVIVGAGISGLALAYRLHRAAPAFKVTILEAANRPGGAVWTERSGGFQVEIGPNGFLSNKLSTLELCRDLGVEDRLRAADEAASRKRYLFLGGRLRRLPAGPLELLRSDLLSWRGKLSLLAERFRPRRTDLGEESVDAFARRRAGSEAAEVLADALVTGIYAGDPHLLSLPAAFPRLAALEAEHGSIMKGMAKASRQGHREARRQGQPPPVSRLWSFPEGLRLLIESLQQQMPSRPLLGTRITSVQPATSEAGQRWIVRGEGENSWPADVVALTCPAHAQATILGDLDQSLAADIETIAYNRIAVIAVGFAQQQVPAALDGFGYISPQNTRRDVLGVQWCSSIFPERAPGGHVLLRAMVGGWHRSTAVDWDDKRLLAAVRADLRAALGIEAAPSFQRIIRWDRAIPQYHLGHLERVRRIEERAGRYPGLFLGGNAYHGVSLNDCTEQAALLAARIQSYLQSYLARSQP
jgi:oxygen-dependent protoporphyrinogen oxidase